MSDNIRTIHWGIMGTARIAEKIAVAIHQANGAELTAVASRSGQRAAAWAAEHKVTRGYGLYAELLDDSELDAIYIPLPPALHAEWTIKAAEKGKHVLCEKPFAMNAGEAREMAAACRENNVQLMDGVMWVHHPRAVEMLQAIQDGTLGELRRVTSAFTFQGDQIPVGDFRLQRELGGGSMLDLGWYCVRVTLWAFGELPQRVFGTARYDNDVDRNFSAILLYDDEKTAAFDSGFDVGLRKWVEVAGTKASLVCDDFTKPWDESRPRFWIHNISGENAEHVTAAPIQEVCMIEEMCQNIRTGNLTNRWPQEAINTQRVCDALDLSARQGEWVEVK